ncbi:hypothetical protein AAY473_031466 [Plecturocebus cupreus]
MGPAEPVRPVYSTLGSAAPGTGKRAALAKRVALATRVASLPGISRSVGNKNLSETDSILTGKEKELDNAPTTEMRSGHAAQADLKLLASNSPPAFAQSTGITGQWALKQLKTRASWGPSTEQPPLRASKKKRIATSHTEYSPELHMQLPYRLCFSDGLILELKHWLFLVLSLLAFGMELHHQLSWVSSLPSHPADLGACIPP